MSKNIFQNIRFLVAMVLILTTLNLQSQNLIVKSETNFIRIDDFKGKIDHILVFNGWDSNMEISFQPDAGHQFTWYRYDQNGLGAQISNQSFLNPDPDQTYVVEIDGIKKIIQIFDYMNYLPVFNSLSIDESENDFCSSMKLLIDGNVKPMSIYGLDGFNYTLPRVFTLEYQSQSWNNGWSTKNISVDIDALKSTILVVELPLQDTYFTLTGDQFAQELGLDVPTVSTSLFEARKLECHIKYNTSVRLEKNEADNPVDSTKLSGSAPLDIQFNGYANTSMLNGQNWQIISDGKVLENIQGDGFRYTFNKAGSFTVKYTVRGKYCSDSDSLLVKVSESSIYAPNVFTPNGDGINDEFRVAYKSIVSFKAVIFNRWGKKVFSWTDPQKGWDGKINGVPAKSGAYFFVIKAVGSDGNEYALRGDINLLRSNAAE